MRRHLLLIGVICALLLSGWSTVLAAVLCPHAGGALAAAEGPAPGEDVPACCRKGKGDENAHCPIVLEEQRHEPSHQADSSHETPASGESQAAAAEDARLFVRPDTSCLHCLGRPEQQPASVFSRVSNGARREARGLAPREQLPLVLPVVSFAPEIVPSQGAPPGGARRHVLISVFLI